MITDVPDGSYTLRAWNEFGGEWREPIAVAGTRLVERAPELHEKLATIEHRNKFGKPYRERY